MQRPTRPDPTRPPGGGVRRPRLRQVIVYVVVGVVAFLAGGLARGLLASQGPELVASAGVVRVNGEQTTESTMLRVGDVVEVVAGQGDVFFAEDRWLRLTPDAEVVWSEGEVVQHRAGTGWYRAAGDQPLYFELDDVVVALEGAALVVDDVVLVADGVAEVDGRRVTAGEAVVAGEVIDLAQDQVYRDPWVKAHLEADHRSEALARVPVPSAEGSMLGDYMAELTVVSSEFTEESGSSMEREADVILRCETRPCSMVLRLARSDGWVELPLSWTGTGYTSAVSTAWPCLTDQRLVGDDIYEANLELDLDTTGIGTLILDLAGSSQPDICHPGSAMFTLTLGDGT